MAKTDIKQHDLSDCGAACLASVASYYKLHFPLSRIRQLASTDQNGTNILGLIEAAEKLGFDAKGVKGAPDSLSKIPIPAIAHVTIEQRLQHFVVIYKIHRNHITIMDPGYGKRRKLKLDTFIRLWTGVLILLLPSERFEKGNKKVSKLKRFWVLMKPHQSIFVQSLFGSLCYTILGFSISIYIQKITDHVLVNGDLQLLNILGLLMICILIIQLFIETYKEVFMIRTGQEIDARLILGYYQHLLSLPQRFFDTMRVGELISRINDAVNIRVLISNTSIKLVVNFFIVLFSFMIMFTYHWKLGLLMLSLIPLYTFVYWVGNKLNKKTERKVMQASADLESQLVESLSSVKTIKQFGVETNAAQKTETRFTGLLGLGYLSSLNQVFAHQSSFGLTQLFTVLLLWIGSYYVIGKDISPGELLSFYAITGYFTGPLSSLITLNKQIQNAMIAADRLFEIMDLNQDQRSGQIELAKKEMGNIVFSDVSFRYGSHKFLFRRLNFTIAKGSITALVGESGSGKSTLSNLLLNLYPLNSGKIKIGDYDIGQLKYSCLRKLIGIVPQKTDLFAGSILQNIALGAVIQDVQLAFDICKKLGLDEFIASLPDGMHTYIGENGVSLSGGQKQRISIARVLYRKPQILILDEATSSLDSLSENYVRKILLAQKPREKPLLSFHTA